MERNLKSYKTAIALCTLPLNFGNRDYFIYQDKMLRVYANSHGIRIQRTINEFQDTEYFRYELNMLRSRIIKKEIDVVLIQDKYRLFSDYYDYLNFEAFCNFHGSQIIALNDHK